jgi:hypothetical protein
LLAAKPGSWAGIGVPIRLSALYPLTGSIDPLSSAMIEFYCGFTGKNALRALNVGTIMLMAFLTGMRPL